MAYLCIVCVCSCVSSVLYFTLGHCMDQCHRSLGSFHLCLFVSPFISAHTFFSKTGTFSSSLICFSNSLPPTFQKNISLLSSNLWSQITQPINQSINQSVIQLINQSISQPINQSINQSIKQASTRTSKQSTTQALSQQS